MSVPLLPPLLPTKPCAKCGHKFPYKERERVCPECQSKTHRQGNFRWSERRSDMNHLQRRVEALEELVQQMSAIVCGCKAKPADGRQQRKERS